VDRRVLVVDAEARIGALRATEAAVGIVDLEDRRVRRIAGVDVDAPVRVVDLRDDAAAGVFADCCEANISAATCLPSTMLPTARISKDG